MLMSYLEVINGAIGISSGLLFSIAVGIYCVSVRRLIEYCDIIIPRTIQFTAGFANFDLSKQRTQKVEQVEKGLTFVAKGMVVATSMAIAIVLFLDLSPDSLSQMLSPWVL